MKVILDANILIVIIAKSSPYHYIWKYLLEVNLVFAFQQIF